jgi:hypothetical protein
MSVSEVVGANALAMPMTMESAVGKGGAAISPGEVDISYQVQVAYFIAR